MNALPLHCPPWLLMWLVVTALYFTFKILMLWQAPAQSTATASVGEKATWLLFCPTFSFTAFHRKITAPRAAVLRLTFAGLLNLTFGTLLMWGIASHLMHTPLLAAWCGMVGFIFTLHLGGFHLVTAFWMQRGHAVEPLMKNPIAAASLAEFWDRRWNTAFRDVMTLLIFRPAATRWGVRSAHWLVFLTSGLLHEAVISLPARGGWGGPTAYFLLQALGMELARRLHLKAGPASRVWTLAFLILPVGLLFHPPFIHQVMLPFMHAIRALP